MGCLLSTFRLRDRSIPVRFLRAAACLIQPNACSTRSLALINWAYLETRLRGIAKNWSKVHLYAVLIPLT